MSNMTPLRLLLVEPHDDSRLIFTDLLLLHGYAVRSVRKASEAISAVTVETPDVVITELFVSDEGAAQMVRDMRNLNHCDETAFILLTSRVLKQFHSISLAEDFSYVLTKPASSDRLLRILDWIAQAKMLRAVH